MCLQHEEYPFLVPEFCNKKGTATKKAFKIAGVIKAALKP
jgi:hypothetical protein